MDVKLTCIFGYSFLLLLIGYFLPYLREKRMARVLAWSLVVLTVFVSTAFTNGESALIRMVIIVFLQLLSMKIIVAVESYRGENRLTVVQWLAFSLGWFGMRPILFEKLPSRSLSYKRLVWKGLSRMIIGIVLLYLAIRVEHYPVAHTFFLPQLILLLGMSLILHFGILNLSTAGWRYMGVEVTELFRAPYRSTSLREFWGKRWNLAFSEMTALIAYRPLKSSIGTEKAITLSFLLSGLLHEIAISFPVKTGYGLPMLYFVIQATAMQLETRSSFVNNKITSHRVFSHFWVMSFLILPLPLLFHEAFVRMVLFPLRDVVLQFVHLN